DANNDANQTPVAVLSACNLAGIWPDFSPFCVALAFSDHCRCADIRLGRQEIPGSRSSAEPSSPNGRSAN
ncbi:MAG: hypothetical protein QGF90_15070, partial [Gammaproteobacteria bacterium]|nr:hypothetical protein [Gammaproteobacteria bacterium]